MRGCAIAESGTESAAFGLFTSTIKAMVGMVKLLLNYYLQVTRCYSDHSALISCADIGGQSCGNFAPTNRHDWDNLCVVVSRNFNSIGMHSKG